MNRLKSLVDSYRLATKRLPPPGQILVHNQIRSAPGNCQGPRSFRAWWATPGEEFVLCDCGWRPDLGQHYRVHRLGPFVRRRWDAGLDLLPDGGDPRRQADEVRLGAQRTPLRRFWGASAPS
jgi:hypothetical protein